MDFPPFPSGCALFLDIDGTVLEIAAKPQAVRVFDSERRLLERLSHAMAGGLALISGRPLSGIDALFAPLVLPAAGQHGVERRDAAGRLHLHSYPHEAVRRAAAELGAFAARSPGLVLEDKGASVALHYRLAPQLEAQVHAHVHELARRLDAGLEVQPGKMVLELKAAGPSKGTAIEAFMGEPPFAGHTPLFVGDDLTDEHGFEAVNRMGGYSIKVGEGDTRARWRLPDVAAFHAWLENGVRSLPGS